LNSIALFPKYDEQVAISIQLRLALPEEKNNGRKWETSWERSYHENWLLLDENQIL